MSNKLEINYKEFYENDGKRANIWKADKNSFMYGREILRYQKTARHLKGSGKYVLDLGCGDGYLSCLLAEMGHKVDAMDISLERLKKFEDRAIGLGITQINDSVYEYEFCNKYDVVILSEIIEHLENYTDILSKAYEILKPGGMLLIAVPYREVIRFCKCPYCLRDINEYGHIHSFDEAVIQKIALDLALSIEFVETFNNKLTAYSFRLSPIKSYGIYCIWDGIFSRILQDKNTHMLVGLKK